MNGVPITLNKEGLKNSSEVQDGSPGFPMTTQGWQMSAGDPVTNPSSTSTGTNANSDNHPQLSASGQWVSSATGQPWHGSYQNPNGTTQFYSNGSQVQDIGQVGIQKPQIGVQQINKNPAISSQVAGAVDQNAQNTGMFQKSFSQYLQEAQNIGSQAPGQLAQAEAAINPAPTISRLNADVGGATSSLNTTLNNYVNSQNQNQGNIASANQNYENTQNTNLATLGKNLTTENQNYATAAQNVAAQAYANALKQTNLYQLQSGTPASGSGALSNRYIADYNAVNLPLQADLANRSIATTNQLYGLGSNLQNQYLGNLQTQYAGVGSLNQDVANRFTSGNQYLTGLDQQTAQYVQGLQQQVASMSPQLAMSYLQSMGVPMQMAQQIISGNTANLSQLTGLDQQANWYNAITPYQNNAPTFSSPRVNMPTAPTQPWTANGGVANGGLLDQANSQMGSLGQMQQNWLQSPPGQAWLAQNKTATSGSNNYGVSGNPYLFGPTPTGGDYPLNPQAATTA
jgi:hypothetical protein